MFGELSMEILLDTILVVAHIAIAASSSPSFTFVTSSFDIVKDQSLEVIFVGTFDSLVFKVHSLRSTMISKTFTMHLVSY